MNTLHIEKPDPAILKIAQTIGYTGRKYRVTIAESFNPNDNHWSGGTRTYQYAIDRTTGQLVTLPQRGTMFDPQAPNTVKIPNGMVIVEHRIFSGTDLGLTFLIRKDEAQTLIGDQQQAPELDKVEQIVLTYTRGRKSSYNGQDRCAMAQNDLRNRFNSPCQPFTREQWNTAKDRMIEAGYLNKAGAITVKGKNAVETIGGTDQCTTAIKNY
ncbi:MAG TPA: hypothetical protein PLE71_17310 [Flavobacteriales bacterium]|nr:hypothetical protein [Flavobacteriales bacterium]HRA18582.1 hypothetical protein [Flavobacteriales bacterium]